MQFIVLSISNGAPICLCLTKLQTIILSYHRGVGDGDFMRSCHANHVPYTIDNDEKALSVVFLHGIMMHFVTQ